MDAPLTDRATQFTTNQTHLEQVTTAKIVTSRTGRDTQKLHAMPPKLTLDL